MKKEFITDLLLGVLLVAVGILTRTIFHLGPNIEFVTAGALASGYFFRKKEFSYVIPLLIMFVTDLILGNTLIYIFTWSGFLITPFIGQFINSKKFKKVFEHTPLIPTLIAKSQLGGVVSTLIFFFWTNFGVVVMSSLYQKNIIGLFQSYVNGIPFLNNQLLGNLIIVPIVFIISYYLEKYNFGYKKNYKS
jgi:hypothetical protein